MMRKARFCAVLGAALLAGPALASSSTSGTIYGISIEDGKVFFYTTGTRTTPPACNIVPSRWVFDATTAKGQAMMSGLMTFYALQQPIAVTGTGLCTDWPDTESVRYIVRP
jgi:hypothetical protein